jgi:hypothetical protein
MVAVLSSKEREPRSGSACCKTNGALVNKREII